MSLSQSTSQFAVETVYDILSNIETDNPGSWTTEPGVYKQWETTQQDRVNNPNPAVYVWAPVEGTLESFSADGDDMVQEQVVEVSCWSLDATDTAQLMRDVISILSEYYNDQTQNTNYERIRPTSTLDNRNENVVQMTDHYVGSVQIDLTRLRPTGI